MDAAYTVCGRSRTREVLFFVFSCLLRQISGVQKTTNTVWDRTHARLFEASLLVNGYRHRGLHILGTERMDELKAFYVPIGFYIGKY